MLPFFKTFQAALALVVVLMCSQTVVAQQWSVRELPVENSVPQYRPRNGQAVAPSNQSALPLDFFSGETKSVIPRNVVPGGGRQSAQPAIVQSNGLNQELLIANPLQDQASRTPAKMVESKVAQPKTDKSTAPAKPAAPKKPAVAKKAAKKKDDKKVADKKKKPKPQPVLDNTIYRDQSLYPIDPRKPNWSCGGGNCNQNTECKSCFTLGNKGRPYHERELGGCECESRKPKKHPEFSVHWPRPFSAKLDERNPDAANARYSACQEKRLVDVFDGLATFKLIDYKRTDNGYSGPNSDCYGCLGESKLQ